MTAAHLCAAMKNRPWRSVAGDPQVRQQVFQHQKLALGVATGHGQGEIGHPHAGVAAFFPAFPPACRGHRCVRSPALRGEAARCPHARYRRRESCRPPPAAAAARPHPRGSTGSRPRPAHPSRGCAGPTAETWPYSPSRAPNSSAWSANESLPCHCTPTRSKDAASGTSARAATCCPAGEGDGHGGVGFERGKGQGHFPLGIRPASHHEPGMTQRDALVHAARRGKVDRDHRGGGGACRNPRPANRCRGHVRGSAARPREGGSPSRPGGPAVQVLREIPAARRFPERQGRRAPQPA